MGAYEVNPNTKERIKLVMDKLLEDVEMKNKHAVKLSFKDKEVVKELNPDTEIRKWVLVTMDGLPMKLPYIWVI